MSGTNAPVVRAAILVVDDDEPIRTLLVEALSSESDTWSATSAEDGAHALAVLDTVRPNLIILDVNMPGLNGIEVYRLLREREDARTTPVLFISANRSPASVKGLEGPFRWLTKPFNLDEFVEVVTNLLSEQTGTT